MISYLDAVFVFVIVLLCCTVHLHLQLFVQLKGKYRSGVCCCNLQILLFDARLVVEIRAAKPCRTIYGLWGVFASDTCRSKGPYSFHIPFLEVVIIVHCNSRASK